MNTKPLWNFPVMRSNVHNLMNPLIFLAALQKAGQHMEDSLIASYAALLLGLLAEDNKVN